MEVWTAVNGNDGIPVCLIDADPTQPRKEFDDDRLDELACSISELGLAEPVVVRQDNGRYQLIAGERRLRAVRKLGWDMVPAVVKECDDKTAKKLQMVENVVRQDLNPIELANGLQQMLDDGMDADDVAKSIGRKPSYIVWITAILGCRQDLHFLVANGQIKVWVAWHLARLSANGQGRAIRRFRMGDYNAEEQVAICEAIYADEHQSTMFTDVNLTSAEKQITDDFDNAITKIYRSFDKIVMLEKKKPGSVAKWLNDGHQAHIARLQIKELKSRLSWLDKLLRRKEASREGGQQ